VADPKQVTLREVIELKVHRDPSLIQTIVDVAQKDTSREVRFHLPSLVMMSSSS
jgi:hypothetical protein